MKNECKIISDLLPLYLEDMVCEETAEFVKNHLAECENCKNDFETFQNGDDLKEVFKEEATKPTEDIKPFKKIMKKMYEIYYEENKRYIDWMGFEIDDENYPTYHHIEKREDLISEDDII